MGNATGLKVVSNSGPLIHLAQIGMIDLLDVFQVIYIPQKVYEEVCIAGMPGYFEIKEKENIKVLQVSDADVNIIKNKINEKLHDGEMHALALCNKLAGVFLTDDLDARCAAEKLNIEVHGSIGIIVRAYHENLINIEQSEKALNDLYAISNLFITRAIVDIAISEIRKYRNKK